jgi:hypothetical protein
MPPCRCGARIETFLIDLSIRAPQLDELAVRPSLRLTFGDFAPDLIEWPTPQLRGYAIAPQFPSVRTYPAACT